MKKLSLSLFAVLAVVFAAASAFTTKSAVLDLQWAELQSYVSTASFTEAAYDASFKNTSLYQAPVVDPADTDCIPTSQDQVCALQIDLDANGVAGFQNADFPADRPTAIRYNDIP